MPAGLQIKNFRFSHAGNRTTNAYPYKNHCEMSITRFHHQVPKEMIQFFVRIPSR